MLASGPEAVSASGVRGVGVCGGVGGGGLAGCLGFVGGAGLGFGYGLFGFGGGLLAESGFVPVGAGGQAVGDDELGTVGVELVAVVDLGIDEGEGDFGHAGGFAVAGAGEDDVFHLDAAEAFGGLLAEDPGDGVGDVGFAAAVGADDGGDAVSGELDLGSIAEGLEAEDLDFFELEHARRGLLAVERSRLWWLCCGLDRCLHFNRDGRWNQSCRPICCG